jgi:hypothetical protein
MIAFPKASASSFLDLSRCNAILRAVFLPMPGNFASSFTAVSKTLDGSEFTKNCLFCKCNLLAVS